MPVIGDVITLEQFVTLWIGMLLVMLVLALVWTYGPESWHRGLLWPLFVGACANIGYWLWLVYSISEHLK